MTILFFTNLLPYPLDNGGKIKTYTTLKALSEAGNNVNLVCFKEVKTDFREEENELLKVCDSIHQVYQRLTTADNKKYMIALAFKSLFTGYPLSSYKFISREMIKYIESLRDRKYDLIYFDHLPMYVYYNQCKKMWPQAKFILDEHNCEATIMKRNADISMNPIKKLYMNLEAAKVRKFETYALLSADKAIILSEEDYATLRAGAGRDFSHSIIPIGVVDKGIKKRKENADGVLNILFLGTLTWEPNNQGLLWFIDNVIPLMETEEIRYRFYIVGKNPSEEIRTKTSGNEKITLTGYVESVDKYYDLCDMMVVPLFIGSGQRVKLIESFSKGMPAISTTIGAEGLNYTDGGSLLIADNQEEFVNAIKRLNDSKIREKVGEDARKIYEEYYSTKAVEELLINAIGK